MNTATRCLVIAALLLVTAHRLPAPISETPESPTPAPAPAAEQSEKAKPKRTTKPKVKSEGNEPAANPARQQPSAKQSRFAGVWVGTMSTIPYGSLPAVVTIDPTETAMAVSWYDAADSSATKTHEKFTPAAGNAAVKTAFARAKLSGNTLTASFPAPMLGTSTWSITPEPGGRTARARMQAFFNDFSAVFQKQSGSGNITTPVVTAPQKSQVPTAKPVPDRPGFVYNPFSPNSNMLFDVRGKTSGTKVKDPTSGKLFVVP
jgi:hypothetical protein